MFQPLHPGEQVLRERSNLQEPLVELALLHLRARSPALAVDHLFIGEHGHVDRVPVDLALAAIDQPRFEQVDEQRLLVAVVFRIAGGEFAAPVEREAQLLQLPLHRGDIGVGPAGGVDALFHRRVLGGHAEGVPAHRMQHFVALHLAEPGQHVAHGVIADMADVDAPAGIGEHLQHVALGLAAGGIRLETAGFIPGALPAPVGDGRIEIFRCSYPAPSEVYRTVERRRSRALVRMISSSRWIVAACTGASTHWPPCKVWRLAATRSASARRS